MEKVLHFLTGVWRSCKDVRPPPWLICKFNTASNTPQRKLDISEVHPGGEKKVEKQRIDRKGRSQSNTFLNIKNWKEENINKNQSVPRGRGQGSV